MLELLGTDYLIDHVVSEHNRRAEERTFRIYVGDMLKAVVEMSGTEVPYRYAELIERPTTEEKTADEIAYEVICNAGLKVQTNGLT